MNCPHCQKLIYAFTGLQEAQKFAKHLGKCRKRVTVPRRRYNLMDALNQRAESGQ